LLAIIKYAAAFMPHLTSPAERRVVRLMVIHILRKARPPRYVAATAAPIAGVPIMGPPPSTSTGTGTGYGGGIGTIPQFGRISSLAGERSGGGGGHMGISRSLSFNQLLPSSTSTTGSTAMSSLPGGSGQSTPHHMHTSLSANDKLIGGGSGSAGLLITPRLRRPSESSSNPSSGTPSRESSPPSRNTTINYQPGAPSTPGSTPPGSQPGTPSNITASSLMPPPASIPVHHHQAPPGGLPYGANGQPRPFHFGHHQSQQQQQREQRELREQQRETMGTPQSSLPHSSSLFSCRQQAVGTPIGRSQSTAGGMVTQPSSHATTTTTAIGVGLGGYETTSSNVRSDHLKHMRVDTNIDSPNRSLISVSAPNSTVSTPVHMGTPIGGHTHHPTNISASVPPTLPRAGSSNALQSLPFHPSSHHQVHIPPQSSQSLTIPTPTGSRPASPMPVANLSNTNTLMNTQMPTTGSTAQTNINTTIAAAKSNLAALKLLRAVIATELLSDELILNEVLAQQHDHQLDRKRSKLSRYHHVQQPPLGYQGGSIGGGTDATSPSSASASANSSAMTTTTPPLTNDGDDEIDQYLSFGSSYVIESS
jgi:hypothetical protein